jgi:two-component system, response regulator YesN
LRRISNTISILYIEDEPSSRLGMCSLLSAVFPSVEMYIASNGLEAQKLFNMYSPDIILTDISLPDMDGSQMADEFRRLSPETITIFLSGRDYKDYPHLAKEIGSMYLLTKPVDCTELIEIVKYSIALVTHRKYR